MDRLVFSDAGNLAFLLHPGYTWNEKLFPNPKGFCKELHDRKLRITLNDHPADGVAYYEDAYSEMARALDHDTSQKAPIDRRFFDAYFDILHRHLENNGCDFWWIDWQSGPFSRVEGIDPLWMLNHYHFLDNKVRDKNTPMIFSRYAGPGSHRYPVGFSGDTVTTFESLDFQPEFTAMASNIGYGWWSHDIGGHMQGYRNDELVARWVQLGVFSPLMRLHSTSSIWMSKEPWLYGHDAELALQLMLRFRHRLLPYLHTMNIRAHKEDEPIVQPMYWHWPQSREAYDYKNQFVFGSELMVAPITSPQDPVTRLGKVETWLPGSRWVDIFNGRVYDGTRVLFIYRDLCNIPVFAREGSILPLDHEKMPASGAFNPKNMEIQVVVGMDGQFVLKEDSVNGDVGAAEFSIVFNQQEGSINIGASTNATPSVRNWWVLLLACDVDESQVEVWNDGSRVSPLAVLREQNGTLISIGSIPTKAGITVRVGNDPQLRVTDGRGCIRDIIMGAQVDFADKQKIWDIIENMETSRVTKASHLQALEVHKELKNAVMEVMFADSRET